jgi:UDP-N-acetyl-D-mannosaminuronic acid dehydrogenase
MATSGLALSSFPEPALDLDLVIVGGCGHVGLPLALSLADLGCRVGIYDVDRTKLDQVSDGEMPFLEAGAEQLLGKVLPTGRLEVASHPAMVARTDTVVLVIGTPLDEFMNPSLRIFDRVVRELAPSLRAGSLVILRSTVFPGTTDFVKARLDEEGVDADVVFCPERIAEGHAIEELRGLPQIIGASNDQAFERARGLFQKLDVEIIRTTPMEAELAKLFTNTWRYMKFAVANQFFQIAHRANVDYNAVLNAIRYKYPRCADLPGPGFAAGPCLLKDTMQLAAFTPDHFPLGHSAMLVNEGMPHYIVDTLAARGSLAGKNVGILGMAFKADSDDPRSSLSYRLKKLLMFRGANVLTTDPFVPDRELRPLDEVISRSEILIVGAPHSAYRGLQLEGKQLVDIWGITEAGIRL